MSRVIEEIVERSPEQERVEWLYLRYGMKRCWSCGRSLPRRYFGRGILQCVACSRHELWMRSLDYRTEEDK